MSSHSLTRTEHWRGRTVAWDVLGAGPPVVLMHGTPWSSALWAPIARTLAASYTVYLWDMPGYGASASAGDPPWSYRGLHPRREPSRAEF